MSGTEVYPIIVYVTYFEKMDKLNLILNCRYAVSSMSRVYKADPRSKRYLNILILAGHSRLRPQTTYNTLHYYAAFVNRQIDTFNHEYCVAIYTYKIQRSYRLNKESNF